MQAYDVKRKRVINVEKMEGDAITAYSVPGSPDWYMPLVENGKNVEPYEILKHEQLNIDFTQRKGAERED